MTHYLWQIENIIKKYCKACPSSGEVSKLAAQEPLDLSQITRDSFWTSENIGNNSYGFKKGTDEYDNSRGSRLFCPKIVYSDKFNIKSDKEPIFRDHEIGKEFTGINHYLISHSLRSNTPIFICDNHNLVLEAWRLVKDEQLNLIHIDQHFDNAQCEIEYENIQSIYKTKICNYINFAKKSNWIGKTLSFVESKDLKQINKIDNFSDIILNIDLDFFAPEVNLISLEDKINLIFKSANSAKLITLATSPGFIDQTLAIKIAQLLFKYL